MIGRVSEIAYDMLSDALQRLATEAASVVVERDWSTAMSHEPFGTSAQNMTAITINAASQ
jgi:hypothetical protein